MSLSFSFQTRTQFRLIDKNVIVRYFSDEHGLNIYMLVVQGNLSYEYKKTNLDEQMDRVPCY